MGFDRTLLKVTVDLDKKNISAFIHGKLTNNRTADKSADKASYTLILGIYTEEEEDKG